MASNVRQALLKGMGAELPGTFHRPDKGVGSGVWGLQSQGGGGGAEGGAGAGGQESKGVLPDGAVVALLELSRVWLQQGGGIATGLVTTGRGLLRRSARRR